VIVRLMGEGQYDVADDLVHELNTHDDQVEAALASADEAALRAALEELAGIVRRRGSRLAEDSLVPSDIVLPPSDATLREVVDLLGEDGLVPG
jgi:hypothetical protein